MNTLNNIKLIGIDLGGTKVNVGLVQGSKVLKSRYEKIPSQSKNEWDVINLIIKLTKEIIL